MNGYPKNFSREEMLHSNAASRLDIDNDPDSEQIEENILKTALFLQKVRDKITEITGEDKGIRVLSCYRCPKLNIAVGGSKTSAHKLGLAADIVVDGWSVDRLAKLITDNFSFDQVILEFGQWVHVGIETENSKRNMVMVAKKVGKKTIYKPIKLNYDSKN